MIPLLASLQVLSVGAGLVGVMLAWGQVNESEALSRSLRDCVTRVELRGDKLCESLAAAMSQNERASGVVLAGLIASVAGGAAVLSRRPPQG